MQTQPNPSVPTLAPTSGGGSCGCASTSMLFAEFEGRRQLPSDMQDHMLFLYRTARHWPGGAKILELGVRRGNSPITVLAALESRRARRLPSLCIAPPAVPASWYG